MVSSKPNARSTLPKAASVVLWLVGWTLLVSQTCPPPPVTYIYDEGGRLAAVVDETAGHPSDNVAIYSYDAAGNILSIARQPSSQVSVISFTPGCATTGAPVTIYGTGFSSTPSQDTVEFDRQGGGTPVVATVSTASSTVINTTVPANAATGTIKVTVTSTPGGMATSTRNFVIGCVLPIITGFSPQIALPGDAVGIDGQNFDPVSSNNAIRFNIAGTATASASAVHLNTTVPATGSGRLSVRTPTGQAVSGDDFKVPPSGYTVADVDLTASGRTVIGQGRTMTIAATKMALVLFDVTRGQRIGALVTYVGTNCPVLLDPLGTFLSADCKSTGAFVEEEFAPASGTYTVYIKPTVTSGSSSATVTPYLVPADVDAGTVSLDGTPVSVTTTSAGQNARMTFQGILNQRVSVTRTGGDCDGSVAVTFKNPLDSQLDISGCAAFIEPFVLPLAGTYKVLLDPFHALTGTWTLRFYDIPPDLTGSLTLGAGAVPVSLTTPGRNAQLSFSFTGPPTTQPVTVRVTQNTFTTNGCTRVELRTGGTPITWADAQTNPSSCSQGSFNLPQSQLSAGTPYTVSVDPVKANTGSMSVAVTSP